MKDPYGVPPDRVSFTKESKSRDAPKDQGPLYHRVNEGERPMTKTTPSPKY